MRLNCEKSVLDGAIATISRAVSARSPLPILGHILLEANESDLHLTATDLNLWMRTCIAARVEEPGALTCPARLLSDIVGRLPAGPVTLEVSRERMLRVNCGRAEFELSTLPAEEFPDPPVEEDASEFSLPRRVLKRMIQRVAVAAADVEDTRPVFTGILSLLEPERLTLVATDGRRLARMTESLPVDPNREARVVIPGRAMQELARLLSDNEEPVVVRVMEKMIGFRFDSISVHSRLLEGTYPDFTRVVPEEFQRTCRLGREAFVEGLRRVLVVAQEKDTPHLVRCQFQPDCLVLSANTPDLGSGRDLVPAVLEGEPLLIAFNGRFLLDVLTSLEVEEVQVDLQDGTRSAVIRPFGEVGYDYVVMPVRLRELVEEEANPVPAGV